MMTQEKKIQEAMIAKIKERRGIRVSAKSEQKKRGRERERREQVSGVKRQKNDGRRS